MKFDTLINTCMTEDAIKGGKADKQTPESIAKHHKVSIEDILYQVSIGVKVEMEHTNDPKIAKEISLDHLFEFPDYYTRLKKMEAEAKKGTDVKEEMVSTDVVGTSGYQTSGVAPQDDIPYAKGDTRIPKSLFSKGKKKKKKQMHIFRRSKIKM